MSIHPVHTTITIRACDQGELVTDRVASRHYTRTLTEHTQGERAAQKRTKQYQRFIIDQLHSACSDEEIYNAAIKTFLSLSDTLKSSSMIQFPDQPHLNEELALKYQQATEAASSESSTPYLCLAQLLNLLYDLSTHEGLTHPLLVAVLAYCMEVLSTPLIMRMDTNGERR
jgi:hypothetical protein